MDILVIDNYDSFVYNLVQYLGELGVNPIVRRHDDIDLAEVEAMGPDGVLISPGPGTPSDAGISSELILDSAGTRPVFGVCLGMQCIGEVFGGTVVRAPAVMHGKTSMIHHRDSGVFSGLPQPFEATRYHSLVIEQASLPDCLEITAWTVDGAGEVDEIMGVRHREYPIEGVQFHPESILTRQGHDLLANFLNTGATA